MDNVQSVAERLQYLSSEHYSTAFLYSTVVRGTVQLTGSDPRRDAVGQVG